MASGADTHTHTHTRILTSRTKAISRNQARAGHRPVRTWFKNVMKFLLIFCKIAKMKIAKSLSTVIAKISVAPK